MKRLAWMSLILWAKIAVAGTLPGLPPDDVVREALLAHPDGLAAGSDVRYESANRSRLEAGDYEWNLRLGGQQRKTLPKVGDHERFNEWNVAIERPLRLPGKAATDAEIGAAGVARAETALDIVRHEIKRDLLQSWFSWLREDAAARQWAAQVALLQRQLQAVRRRQELGDAARLETVLTEAVLAQAEAQATQAVSRQQAAREVLRRRYPALPISPPGNLGESVSEVGEAATWQVAIARNSHELALARQQTQLATLAARRQRQDRVPDPSFGIAYSRERGGEEQVVGAYISIPLAGSARRANEAGGAAQAEAARFREEASERRLALETAAGVQAAQAARTAFQASRMAAERLQEAAAMAGRAYQLGEGTLGDWLTALRVANEGQLAATHHQLEALEKHYRLMLDAQLIWQMAGE